MRSIHKLEFSLHACRCHGVRGRRRCRRSPSTGERTRNSIPVGDRCERGVAQPPPLPRSLRAVGTHGRCDRADNHDRRERSDGHGDPTAAIRCAAIGGRRHLHAPAMATQDQAIASRWRCRAPPLTRCEDGADDASHRHERGRERREHDAVEHEGGSCRHASTVAPTKAIKPSGNGSPWRSRSCQSRLAGSTFEPIGPPHRAGA